jgi:hypothetical protein
VSKSRRLKPVHPIAGARLGCEQRMALDVGRLPDRPLREQRGAHDEGVHIIEHTGTTH